MRFSPEQLLDPSQFHERMLQQAAQDARVIEQLRAWLTTKGNDPVIFATSSAQAKTMETTWMQAMNSVLAELDRLAPPQRQE